MKPEIKRTIVKAFIAKKQAIRDMKSSFDTNYLLIKDSALQATFNPQKGIVYES